MSNSIVPVNSEGLTWVEAVNTLLSELDDAQMPDKVMRAAECLVSGMPIQKTAKEVGVTPQTIRNWIVSYPVLAVIIDRSKELMRQFRLAALEQQFVQAVNRSGEILSVGLDGVTPTGEEVDPKVLTVVAAQARYVIGLFAGQQSDVNVKHTHVLDTAVLAAQKDALDYIADKLDNTAGEPIEAVFRVIDPKVDSNAPMLDENGDPLFGSLGSITVTEDGLMCHICGKSYKKLGQHIQTRHAMENVDYELLFALSDGAVADKEKSYGAE